MEKKYLIHASISNQSCKLNGETILENIENLSVNDWLKTIYLSLKTDYSKFYKMDEMCKMGLLGIELLKQKTTLPEESDDIALLFVNKYASLASDVQHQELINTGKPSPAIFVYTLPNIVLGEISIRNKWYGEQLFLVKNIFPTSLVENYIATIFETEKANTLIIGQNDCFENILNGKWAVVRKSDFESHSEEIIQELISLLN
ncbi:MAG: hypothetical protein ABI207_01725 [Crocinitomicaceae bacterium]